MLYPVQNNFRSLIDLSGLWKVKVDPQKIGEKEKWYLGFDSETEIAVPGSWNEQLEEQGLLHYIGSVWYSKKVFIPKSFRYKRTWLRIGSADYNSKVWINGKYLGENNSGFLPFEFEITNNLEYGVESEVIILVNNELDYETIPQGIFSEDYQIEKRLREETTPPARFDFTPNGGIHRPVHITNTPVKFIKRLKVDSKILGKDSGLINLHIETEGMNDGLIKIEINGGRNHEKFFGDIKFSSSLIKFEIKDCRLWSPSDPFLYNLNIQLMDKNEVVDEYTIPVGIRDVKISGNKLLINNEEIYLKGFGKHEDYSVIGKGLFLPLMVKDFELLKWINANSFRTSHYPYAEELMSYADKKGVLIIDEVPAVSLDFQHVNERTLKNHKEFIKRLIDRDYNHPSVIMWALGNEPNLVGDEKYYNGSGRTYWKEIFNYAREHDKSRPLTVPNCTRAGIEDPVFEFCDVLSLNRYYGWYEHPGQLDYAIKKLSDEMDEIFKRYKKPVLFTEFGADTIPGFHSTSMQMFTEEFQTTLIEKYIELIRSKDYTIGEQVWNFADFRTPQHFRRVVLNMKGVFTRERTPKNAAFKLREIWKDTGAKKNSSSGEAK